MKLITAALFLFLTGCAGSSADRDFRTRVEGVEIQASAQGTVSGRLKFRDPREDGFSK